MEVSQRINVKLPYNPAILFLDIYSKQQNANSKDTHTPVFTASLFTSQDMEAIEMPINR